MKLILVLFVALLSSYVSADMNWCDYELKGREPNRNESIMCPDQKIGEQYSKSLRELSSVILAVQKQFPQHSKSYQKIESDLLNVIEKQKAYTEARCEFESYSYLIHIEANYNGNDNAIYYGICLGSYIPEATTKINEIVEACKTIDENYGLPCVY